MNATRRAATAADGEDYSRLADQAVAITERYCRGRPHVDRDAAESIALAAALEAKRRWEEKRSKLADFIAFVVESRLRRAYKEQRLYGDADARRLGAQSLSDLELGSDAEPTYCDADAECVDADDFVGGLPLSAADRELLRERIAGDYRIENRDDRTPGEVKAALRRIRRAAEDTLNRRATQCSH